MNTKEVLIAARKKIERPENWTTHGYAKDANGRELFGNDPDAVCWCAVGAVDSVASCSGERYAARSALVLALPGRNLRQGVIGFNDTATHARVLALFDRAIAAQDGA